MIFFKNNKLIFIFLFTLFFNINCSVIRQISYFPSAIQGNYLVSKDIIKIHEGLSKKQVEYTLGTPSMKDPFGLNVWYYIFRLEKKIFLYRKC